MSVYPMAKARKIMTTQQETTEPSVIWKCYGPTNWSGFQTDETLRYMVNISAPAYLVVLPNVQRS